jgi:hypothetical protein
MMRASAKTGYAKGHAVLDFAAATIPLDGIPYGD